MEAGTSRAVRDQRRSKVTQIWRAATCVDREQYRAVIGLPLRWRQRQPATHPVRLRQTSPACCRCAVGQRWSTQAVERAMIEARQPPDRGRKSRVPPPTSFKARIARAPIFRRAISPQRDLLSLDSMDDREIATILERGRQIGSEKRRRRSAQARGSLVFTCLRDSTRTRCRRDRRAPLGAKPLFLRSAIIDPKHRNVRDTANPKRDAARSMVIRHARRRASPHRRI